MFHHSTTNTLVDCSNERYVNMDRADTIIWLFFLILKKAFDTVNTIVLKKLEVCMVLEF